MSARRINANDDGFTLPELLVAITVTAVLMPVLFATFVTALRTTDGSVERIAASHDATLSSNYFVPDVQSAESISLVDEADCKAPAGSDRRLTLKSSTADDTVYTGYALLSGQLVRYKCVGASRTEIAVAHDVSGVPTVTCPTSPCAADSRRVVLTVQHETGFTFSLDATRRTTT